MVEIIADVLQRDALPATGVVTGLATPLAKTPFMRISVAVIASAKWQSDVPRLVVGSGRVALFARNLGVQSGQRVLGLGVVELGNVLPIFEVVTGFTLRPEASIMFVFVTSSAGLGNSQEGSIAISNLNTESL